MEQEYRVNNYGIQEKITGEVREVCSNLPDCFGVEWAAPDIALFPNEGTVYKKNPFSNSEEEKRVFSRPGGNLIRLTRRGDIIVTYNNEGRIRLTDTQGNRLREIESGKSAIKSVAFLNDHYIASGGESCRLRIYSILEDAVVFEEEYQDYIESISGSNKYFAVALSSGDIHTYTYSTQETIRADTTAQGVNSGFETKKEEVMSLEHSAKVLFISDSQLFIGLGTGSGYVYDVKTQTLLSEVSMHSKSITTAQLHGDFLITSSLDGKIRVSTKDLREITSLHAGAPILALSALFGEKGGSEYLISTSTGNVVAYRERWEEKNSSEKDEKGKGKEKPVFRSRTLYEAANSASSKPHSLLSLKPRDKLVLNEYEHLVRGFLYQKSLELAISKQDRYTVSSLLAYMHSIDRLSGVLQAIPDESLAYVTDICIYYLKEKSFFPVSESVLKICLDNIEKKLHASNTLLFSTFPRALQELEEEYTVQAASTSLSEYIRGCFEG